MENIIKIMELSKSRIKEFIETKNPWYKWYQTYIEWIQDELKEVQEEIRENNSIYLEDELWDIFWDYICLLNSLEIEWKINTHKVFERSYKKFSERILEVRTKKDTVWVWSEIKQKQKDELKKEHLEKYGE